MNPTFQVIFCEKPSVAHTVAGVVGANSKKPGFFEGAGYRVTWAFGHLVTTAEPEAMNPAWGGAWSMQQLPMIPDQWRYRLVDKAEQQFGVIKSLFLDTSTQQIINAGDAGREGQLIFDLIYNMTSSTKPVLRLWTSSLTDDAIRDALANLQPASAFANLSAAALLRQHWDWINGLSASRAYTIINNQNCPAGRVQTPTLALIINRQAAIDNFSPQTFYEIEAHLHDAPTFIAKYNLNRTTPDQKLTTRITGKNIAEAILAQLAGISTATVTSFTTTEKKANPPALFNLLNLQKEANKRFGYTAQETLDLTQTLYEEYKIVSYPRTESRHLSTDMLPELPRIISSVINSSLITQVVRDAFTVATIQPGNLKDGLIKPALSKAYVDDTKLTDHHAIIPTTKAPPADLPEKPRNIYVLIALRFLSIFLPPEISDEVEILLIIASHQFRSTGSTVKQPGWTLLQPKSKDDQENESPSQYLPQLAQGQQIAFHRAEIKTGKTTPPKSFDDASLLTAMKNAGAEIEDEELVANMKASGLGTPATRAAIIEKLLAVGYIQRKKKSLIPTDKGKAFIAQVHPKLKDVSLTASWESQLHDVEQGSLSPQEADEAFLQFIKTIFPEIVSSTPAPMPAAADPSSFGPCPKCKEGIVRKTKMGAGCSRYKAGCTFSIWAEISGKKLSDEQIRQLVTNGRTKLLKGFKKKDGSSTFDAALFIDQNDFRTKFEFPNSNSSASGASAGK